MNQIQVIHKSPPYPDPHPPSLSTPVSLGWPRVPALYASYLKYFRVYFLRISTFSPYNYSTILTIKNIILTKCYHVLVTHSRITRVFGFYVFLKLQFLMTLSSSGQIFLDFRQFCICQIFPND